MKFPYGRSDFRKINLNGFFYCDRTDKIPLLEREDFQLFLRPRRFGKSLLLSMLANYYDIAKKDEFDAIFGKLAIAKEPTELRNKYLILKWDFSNVDPHGSVEDIKKALHDHINARAKRFSKFYKNILKEDIEIDPQNAINTIDHLVTVASISGYPVYLLIDEYDNFANEVMMGVRKGKGIYEALVYEEGPLKTLFKAVKSSTSESIFDRIFITGVSPVVMSDITSGHNIAENIYFYKELNDLCGFNENEIEAALVKITKECNLEKDTVKNAMDLMRTYYNGYRFSFKADTPVYNPTLALYFLKNFQRECEYPYEMLDKNLSTDEAKLQYISKIPKGRQILLKLSEDSSNVETKKLADRFGIKRMLSDKSKDKEFIVSLLYYFGVLTINGLSSKGKIQLEIPNLVMRKLYIDRIKEMLLPEPVDRDEGVDAAEQLYNNGDMQPLCDFIENKIFKVYNNPDYKWANELTIKTAFLSLLYNDILYVMDSEHEAGRRYNDLIMVIRPDMRRFDIFDVLIEFKYVTLKDAKMTGEKARKLSQDELQNLPIMKTNMKEARKQLKDYSDSLNNKYKKLRLKTFAVIALGFDRLWWEEG